MLQFRINILGGKGRTEKWQIIKKGHELVPLLPMC